MFLSCILLLTTGMSESGKKKKDLFAVNEPERTRVSLAAEKSVKESVLKIVEEKNGWTRDSLERVTFVEVPYYFLDGKRVAGWFDEKRLEYSIRPWEEERMYFIRDGERYVMIINARKEKGEWKAYRMEESEKMLKELSRWLTKMAAISFQVVRVNRQDEHFTCKNSKGKMVFRDRKDSRVRNARELIKHMFCPTQEERKNFKGGIFITI